MAEQRSRAFVRKYRYYEILEVSRNATQDEIRRAYLRLAKIYHPDMNPNEEAHEKFKKINEAYQILSDPVLRPTYDSSPAECPRCWTHEVIQTIETHWRCRHCGCRFDPSRVSEVIEQVEKVAIPERLRQVLRIFQTTQCSFCKKFYTQPFLCPYRRLQSSCVSFDRVDNEERGRFIADNKWWWRMADMIEEVQERGILGRCQKCGALNPNPQKFACWQCGRDTLCCPRCREAPILRYDITGDFWKCPNASCGKRFAIKPKRPVVKPILSQEFCPNCGKNLYYDGELLLWRCGSCRRVYTYQDLYGKGTPKAKPVSEQSTQEPKAGPEISTPSTSSVDSKRSFGYKEAPKSRNHKILTIQARNWLTALILIFALSSIGIAINLWVVSYIPFWLLFGFSLIYSVEKWFIYITRKYKAIGMLYRLLLNLSILSLLGLLIWSGIKLFSQQFVHSSLAGSLIFLSEFGLFIWMWRVVSKNSWRWPSMKLTVFSMIALSVVLAFAGVQPLSDSKDRLFHQVRTIFITMVSPSMTLRPIPTTIPPITSVPPTVAQATLRDPTWSELLDFLQADDTDAHPYVYPTFVCEDFAEMLQNHARKAGWRCAIVTVQLSGYPDFYHYGIPSNTGHALNAFRTTDRGLVYIDDTRAQGGPTNQDNIVDVEIGKQYVPMALFPDPNWLPNSEPMGIVVSIGNPRW